MKQRLTSVFFKLFIILLSQRVFSQETRLQNLYQYKWYHEENFFSACSLFECTTRNYYYTFNKVGQVSGGQTSIISRALPPIQYMTVEFEVAWKSSETSTFFKLIFNDGDPSVQTKLFDFTNCRQSSDGNLEKCDGLHDYFIRGWWTVNSVATKYSFSLEFSNIHEFLIYSFVVYAKFCHPKCLTCHPNNPNQCLTCAYGTPNSSNQCDCQFSNQILSQGNCITACENSKEIQIGDICVAIPLNCSQWNSQGKCLKCGTAMIYEGQCLFHFPQFLKRTFMTMSENLEEIITMTDRVILARAFYLAFFSQEAIEVSGYTINGVGPYTIKNNFWKGFYCEFLSYLLGHRQGRTSSSIIFPEFTITHKYVQISFSFILIDAEIDLTTINIELDIGINKKTFVIDNSKAQPYELCGESNYDYIGIFIQQIEWTYATNQLKIKVKNDSLSKLVSLGVRDIEVIQFNCNPLCASCTRELCLTCDSGQIPDSSGGCKVCPNDVPGPGGICELCYTGCTTCSGTASNQCKSCEDNLQLSRSTCIQCPFGSYNSSTDCLTCDPSCLFCKDTVSTCLTCLNAACMKCKDNKPVLQGKCVDSCVELGDKFHLNVKTNECECSENYSILILLNGALKCSNEVPFGFFCPSQLKSPCISCQDNCEKCATESTCKLCQSGFFLWNNECISDCFPSLSIVENTISRTCECETGKLLKKRDASDIESSTDSKIKSQVNACQVPLELILVELINALSKPKDRESIPLHLQNNVLILTFNRRPTEVEFATFSFDIMKGTLTREKDYWILSTVLEASKPSILIEIQVTVNRSVDSLSIFADGLNNDTILVNNFVLISPELAQQVENDISKVIPNGFESLTSLFVNQDSAFLNYLSRFSKQFQLICKLSNFVQLLTPIYLLSDQLPPLMKYGSFFGASLIFDKIPSYAAVEFTTDSSSTNKSNVTQTRNMIISRNLEETTSQNGAANSLTQMLARFGMTSNLFDNCLGVHLIVLASVFMKLVCYIGRCACVGKQYTILVMDKVTNFIISYIQGSITVIVASIGCAVSSGEGIAVISIYLICYVSVFVNMIVLTFYRDAEYLKKNIPNFFQDINPAARAAKFYLFFAFFKKHLVLLFFCVLFQYQIVCCILIAIIFFLSACMLAYYRYFTNKWISLLKVAQEISICILFVLLAIALQEQKQVLENDIITNDALINSTKWANIVLLSIVVCIFISFIFSVFRSIKQVLEMREAWRKYKEEKKRIDEETQLINKSMSIQMQQGFNSVVKVKKVYLPDLPKKEDFGEGEQNE